VDGSIQREVRLHRPPSLPRSRWTASPNSWARSSGCRTMRGLTR